MSLHVVSNQPSRNIIPSSGAIHTTNADIRRTFYYSSLIIDNGPQSSISRWKVSLGDIIVVAKCNRNQSAQEIIESWKPNHYVKKSPDWRVGLAIALRKVITRHGIGATGERIGTGGIKFECHVQWLEKSLDLDKDEMKSANLKSSYRPYNSNSKSGSQLPHVLINCPGDYGVVSMVTTQQPNEEYNIVLPVNITMMTNRNFMRNGVKEGEESNHELRFCCTKTRRQLRKQSGSLPTGRTIHNEREPDAWVHLNRPGADENSRNGNDSSGNVAPLINKVPGPLQQAWKGWLQTANTIQYTVGNRSEAPELLSPEEKNETEERLAMLGDALMRGWSQSRRERFNKFIVMKEEQQRKALEEAKKGDKDLWIDQGVDIQNVDSTSTKLVKRRSKPNDVPILGSSSKRKSNRGSSTAILAENTNSKKRRKELRFSADTKQPSSNRKRLEGNLLSSFGHQQSSSSASRSTKTVPFSDKIESYHRPQRKKSREATNDDEAASTTTRDTHSTDTTLPTRGAGRKRKLRAGTIATNGPNKVTSNCIDFDDDGIEKAASSRKYSLISSNISPKNITDALEKWKVDSSFSKKSAAFYTTKHKRCFREVRMTIPLADPSIRFLFDEDEVGILDQNHTGRDDMNWQHFHIKIGSLVALHYNDSKSTTNSWSPFQIPWGVAQVTNIFYEIDDDEEEESWRLTIKWFYRYPELANARRAKVLQESMNKIDGLVETFESCDCSVEEILPAYIELTSDPAEFARYSRQEQGKNGLPIVRMLCQHLECSRGKVRKQSDWNYNYGAFLKGLPSSHEGTLPGPYKRSLENMSNQMKKKFNVWFEVKETVDHALDIVPETTGTPFEHKEIEYFDAIRMNVQKLHLHTNLRANSSNRWTIAVGRIIAVHCQHGAGKSRSYPFQKQWCPAQIVALYKKECGTWMMEIRWFDRFRELLQQHKDALYHLNKPYVVFETEVYEHLPVAAALPGRIILSSEENKQNWDLTISDSTGLPLIRRLCNHMCFDEEIDTCMDWTNYDLNLSQIPPGLSRGLLLRPTNRQRKHLLSILSQYYIKTLKVRGADPEHICLRKWSVEENNLMKKNKLICDRFLPGNTRVEPGPHLLTATLSEVSQDFFKSVTIRSPTSYVVTPTIEMKRRKKNCFICAVGDIVCYFDKNASASESYISTHHSKHSWYPFQVPWSYGQVLAIYKELGETGDGNIKVEIRRFYKLSDIADEAKEFLPMHREVNCEEVFESNDVIRALDASHLLGTANVFLGNHESSGDDQLSLGRRKGITSCRCKFFYIRDFRRLQPIFWSSLYPKGWHKGLQQRGYQRSNFILKHQTLRHLFVEKLDEGPVFDTFTPREKTPEEGVCVRLGKSIQSSTSKISFYADASLNPQWSLFCASQYLPLADSSGRKPWTLHVGDIIAVKDPLEETESTSFPFEVAWFPGQILSIFNESRGNERQSIQFEIRCLKFETFTRNMKRKVTVPHPLKLITLSSMSLLGPLTTYSPDAKLQIDLTSTPMHLPLSEFQTTEPLKLDTESLCSLSKLYSVGDKEKLRLLLRIDLDNVSYRRTSPLNFGDPDKHNFKARQGQSIHRPIRLDEINMRAFYSEITILTQYRIFRGGKYDSASISNRVKVGDTVRVRFEGAKRFPYDCNWSVAEVVAVFEKFESKDEFDQIRKSNAREPLQRNLEIEIRWFYERKDLSVSLSAADEQSTSTEVFETDHCQVVDASAVLGHVELAENIADGNNNDVDKFLCTRFWSTKRRTLIPCSGLDGRTKRGKIYSTHGLEDDIRELLSSENGDSLNKKSESWKDSMANLVCKLTLKDASKNAYASGEALVGREKELSQLLSFLRGAFLEDRRSAGYKSSMFLAGPPGVGKTASVRAAIAKLRQEQKSGTIAKFRFISLNGIEVRHPFDIYIKFWESLTGRNHYGPHERACEWLEAYFTSTSPEYDLPENCTTIVLLDEIDYLITSKQSVLYNLFDWPKRAAELSHGRRLIVVGISNTLNLVDQLMPSVQSRVGTERCVFKAYSLHDTTSILKSKIKEGSPNFEFFEDDAILFAAKKTAALSGDIRKAFQLCRSAAQLVAQRYEQNQEKNRKVVLSYPKIRICDVQKASLESFNMAMVTAVSFTAAYEALLLVSLAALCRSTGREVGGFDIKDILTKMEALSNAAGDSQYTPAPSFEETIRVLTRLGEMNLVELQTIKSSSTTFRQSHGGSGGAWPMTSLAIDELTLLKGLKNTTHHELAQKNLPFSF